MALKAKSSNLHDDLVHVHSMLLFQRLVTTVKNTNGCLEDAFAFEMCSVPASLFDLGGLLRQGTKAALATYIWTSTKQARRKDFSGIGKDGKRDSGWRGHRSAHPSVVPSYARSLLRLLHISEIIDSKISCKSKRVQMAKMMTLTLLPTLALLIMSVIDVKGTADANTANEKIRDVITLSTEVGLCIHFLQRERGYTAMHVSYKDQTTEILMKESFQRTDSALAELSTWPGQTKTTMKKYPTFVSFTQAIEEHRDDLVYTQKNNHSLHTEMSFYINLIDSFIDWMYRAIQFAQDGDDWRQLVAYQLLLSSKNDIGIERTLGSIYYLTGSFASHGDYLWYLEKQSMGAGNLRASKLFSPTVGKTINEKLASHDRWNLSFIARMREEIGTNAVQQESFMKSKWWFDNMSIYLDTMFAVQEELAEEILGNVSVALSRDNQELILSISLLVAITLLCPLILVSVRAMVSDIQRYANTLSEQTRELNRERKRAEFLLYQMLPEAVATQLKQNKNVSAESYDDVTIFFSDVVGFTTISASCSPLEVVSLLNTLYSCFDARLEIYDVYKVETIGDAYMVSSGVPKRNGRRHVTEISTMALDLAHHVTHLEIPHLPGKTLHLRAGVNTGPVVAGVVGSKMPRYCLFGDTVNTASRMESTGEADKIQVSRGTYHAILSMDVDFTMEPRGFIEIKGKGQMETYWLLDKEGFEKSLPCMPNCRKFNDVTFRRISKTQGHDQGGRLDC
ncbi:uncharacterized protein [Littorina saxatilis]|uniref:uncharacterized protein n=1 Tax=Littorina saxatilis TaxID=31220 RepID=UPI0038B5E6B9